MSAAEAVAVAVQQGSKHTSAQTATETDSVDNPSLFMRQGSPNDPSVPVTNHSAMQADDLYVDI